MKKEMQNYNLFQFFTNKEREVYTDINNCLVNEHADPIDQRVYHETISYIICKLYEFYSIDLVSNTIKYNLYDNDMNYIIDRCTNCILNSIFIGWCEYSLYTECLDSKGIDYFLPQYFYTIASIFCKIYIFTICHIL